MLKSFNEWEIENADKKSFKVDGKKRNCKGYSFTIEEDNMEDMAVLTDKLLVLNNGNLVMFDKTENVFARASELKAIGLNVPMVTNVLMLLKEKGVELPDNILTVDQAVKALLNLKKGGEAND